MRSVFLHRAAQASGNALWRIGQNYVWDAQTINWCSVLLKIEQCTRGALPLSKGIVSSCHASCSGHSLATPVSTSVFCLPGDDILLSKKMARQLRAQGVPEDNVVKFQENSYILEALCKSFVRYTKFSEWISNYGVKDPRDVSNIIIQRPTLLRTPRKHLEKNMKRYGMMGIEQQDVGRLAVSNPAIMAFDHKMLMGAIKRFRRVGFSDDEFQSIVMTTPTILTLAYNLKLETTIQWLVNNLELGSQKTRQAILHSPWLLDMSESELNELKTYFRGSLGLSKDQLKRMTQRNPGWIGANLEKEVIPMVQYLKSEYRINEQVIGNLFSTQPGLLVKPIKNMKDNREYLMSIGVSADDMLQIVLKAPTALFIDRDYSLKLKMDFLQEELERPIMDIVMCPGYLACRLKIILLRSAFLGPSRTSVKLRKLVEPNAEIFVHRTGKSTMPVYEKFSSEWTAPPKWKRYFPFQEDDPQDGDDDSGETDSKPKPKVYREGEKGFW